MLDVHAPSQTPRRALNPFPRRAPYFDFSVHPHALQYMHGEILPILSLHPHDPGLDGVSRFPDQRPDPTAMRVRGTRFGSVFVPHSIIVIAWGVEREDYVDIYDGTGGDYCVDAWYRPANYGGIVTGKRDPEGLHRFLRQCLSLIYPTGVPPEVLGALSLPSPDPKAEK